MQHMDIGPGFGVFLLMNNYFHDVATALVAASGILLAVLVIKFESDASQTVTQSGEYFERVYNGMKILGRFALAWVLIGGIPRTLYFRGFEWKNAVEHEQTPALIVKHVLALLFVAIGAFLWKKYSARAIAIISPQIK